MLRKTGGVATILLFLLALLGQAAPADNIFRAVLGDQGKTAEVSTEEMRDLLENKSAVVFDARPPLEYAISHIPGALNVAQKPDTPMSLYISDAAEIGRRVEGKKDAAIVLYCNGPFCGKSRRLADDLLAAGFKNVRRYQLGIPIWRALGGVTQIETEGVAYVLHNDESAVLVDAREPEFLSFSLPGAVNVPRSKVTGEKDTGEVKLAKDDGRLPMHDHNTRIVVFGKDAEQARYVAESLAREAFHNVSYLAGSASALQTLLE